MKDEDLKLIRARNLRRENYRKMDSFCSKLRNTSNFRKSIRPDKENNNDYTIPLDQISQKHDYIISQSKKQREVIINCTRISIDNNHEAAPLFAERSLSIRGLLHGREWFWVGDVLCLRKSEELHRRVAKSLWDKCCTCGGTGRGCALQNIKAICSDFEIGLWRPFLQELHKHQQ